MNIDSSFLAALEEFLNQGLSDQPENVHSDLVSFTTEEFVRHVYSINPYLHVSQEQIESLKRIYTETWQRMKQTKNITATLSEFHYPELSKWLATLYPEKFQEVLKDSSGIGRVTYGEYSAELQIELLGIDTACINQPVLDVGCGSQANLVTYFRSLNIQAYGIDRHLEIHEPYLDQVDWFNFTFEPDRWGTIVAHMSFTNHLHYAYRNDHLQFEHYLRKMKEILRSLLIGGSFHYAPSLPFIEDELPADSYTIQREQKFSDMPGSIIVRTK